jgi:hypothetical protein
MHLFCGIIGGRRKKASLSASTIYLLVVVALGQLQLTFSQSGGYTTTSSSSGYDDNGTADGWKKFSVIVPYEDALTPALPAPTVPNQPVVIPALSFLTSENVVLSLTLDDQIGRYHQRCILPPGRQGTDPTANLQDEADYYNWDCTWVFELNLRGSRPGTITLQGAFNRIFRPTVTDTAFPRGELAPPDKQFVTITGGTGCFRAVIGVVKIQVQNPTSIPPYLRYTFYIKIYE